MTASTQPKPHQVFISYGRGDDEPFVKRLVGDLGSRAISVWWDRQAMESRGQTFLQVLRDAISEQCDRVVLVVGPHAVGSDYVRKEWQHALTSCKVVVPIVRLGDAQQIPASLRDAGYNLIPQELSLFHAVDFRDEARYPQALDELVGVLQAVERIAGPIQGLPLADAAMIERPEYLDELRRALLADVERTAVIGSARQTASLQGMGGIGKTVLAAAFARECRTRRAFHDGVVWLTMGRHADAALTQARLLGEALHEVALAGITDAASLPYGLSKALQPRACLLVLDDVWSVEQARPFVNAAAGSRSRVLLTTRDDQIVRALGAIACRVDLLDAVQAQHVFAQRVGLDPTALPPVAVDLIAECDRLPLALALVGAALRGRPLDRWADLLAHLRSADLERLRIEFPEYREYPSLLAAMAASVEALPAPVGAAYFDLAVFDEDERIPEAALQRLWGTEILDAAAVRERIDLLVDRSLLTRDDAGRLSVHDIQLDFLRRRCPDRAAVRERLLAAYAHCAAGDWLRVPDDGFIHRRLLVLLAHSARPDDVHWLLAQEREGASGWYAVRAAAGHSAGFVEDLHTAHGLAIDQCIAQLRAGRGARTLPELVQYVLARASLASIGAGLPAALWAVSVHEGRRDPGRALDAARTLPQLEAGALYEKCAVLIALAEVVPDGLATEAIAIGLDSIEQAIARAEIEAQWIAGPLALLVRGAPVGLMERAGRLVDRLEEGARDKAMGPLAIRWLELGEVSRAMSAADMVTLDAGPGYVLREMAQVATHETWGAVRERFEATVNTRWRNLALDTVAAGVARHDGQDAALRFLGTLCPGVDAFDAFRSTAPHLQADSARQALAMLAGITETSSRVARARVVLAERLPADEGDALIKAVWEEVFAGWSKEHGYAQVTLLTDTDSRRWPAAQLTKLSAAPDRLEDREARRALAAGLVVRGEGEALLNWIADALNSESPSEGASLIAAAAPVANETMVAELQALLACVKEPREREIAQAALLSRQAALGAADSAWSKAMTLQDDFAREQAIRGVVGWLRGSAVDHALRALSRIDDDVTRERWTDALELACSAELDALNAALNGGQLAVRHLGGTLTLLAQRGHAPEALQSALEQLQYRDVRAKALLVHVQVFGVGDGAAAVRALESVDSEWELWAIARDVAPYLGRLCGPAADRQRERLAPWARERFTAYWETPIDQALHDAVALHAWCSGVAALDPALAASRDDESPFDRRFQALMVLLPQMDAARQDAAVDELVAVVERVSNPYLPLMRAGGFHELPQRLYGALKRLLIDRCEIANVRSEAAELAKGGAAFGDYAFAALIAEQLVGPSPELALAVWLAMYRARAPDPVALIARATQAAVRITNPVNRDDWRSNAIARLVPALIALSPTAAMPILGAALGALGSAPRDHVLRDLQALAPLFAALGGTEVLGPMRLVTERVARWWP